MLEDSRPRRVVPRWRASWKAAQTPEGQSNKSAIRPDLSRALERAKRESEAASQVVPIAAELMFVAQQAGSRDLAVDAAQTILSARDHISSSSLLKAADRIVSDIGVDSLVGSSVAFIKEARRSLRMDFQNPVLLMDVARAMTASGNALSAERFVKTALALAPTNRFILRSAVRYFLHLGQREHAHYILLKSSLLKGDPWIQASEIAVATVLGKTSRLVKATDRMLEASGVLLPNQSELGSAIATVHFNAGSDKRAKRLFAKTLDNPNDNVVAQAEWAARRLGLVVTEAALKVKYSFEANSAYSYRVLRIDKAIEQAIFWQEDEPFASRPVSWLAHLYAINDDFQLAAEYHQKVLELEKEHDTGDLLNLNFSRIETGALDEALPQLLKLSKVADASKHRAQILANAGALTYAEGGIEEGRDLYEAAARTAKAAGDLKTEALVRAFFARASVKYGDPQSANIIAAVAKLPTLNLNPSATHVVRRLVDEETKKRLESSSRGRVAKQKLEWDSVNNILTLK